MDGRAYARARRFRQTLCGPPAHRHPRVSLSTHAGLRFSGDEIRRRTRGDRSEVQSAGGARAPEALQSAAAMHPDDAASRRDTRRRQDVEVARQLRWYQRISRSDLLQVDVDLRRADVALLGVALLRISGNA